MTIREKYNQSHYRIEGPGNSTIHDDMGALLALVDELVELHNTPDEGGPYYDDWKTGLLKRVKDVVG